LRVAYRQLLMFTNVINIYV